MNVQLDVEMRNGRMDPFSTAAYPTQLALDYNSDGRLTLSATTSGDLGLWCISQMAYNSTEWELAWTELAVSRDIRQFAVVRDPTPPESAFK